MGSQRKRVRTYSKTGDEGKPLKKARRVEVAFEEDKLWENIVDSCIKGSTRGNNVDKKQKRGNTKVEGMSNKNSKEENFFLFQSRSRGEVGKLGHNDKKSSSKGKGIKSVEDGTPKRPKKLPLAPASKSPTEEDCSYGWQQSCWQCSRRSSQLRLCSACQVCVLGSLSHPVFLIVFYVWLFVCPFVCLIDCLRFFFFKISLLTGGCLLLQSLSEGGLAGP